MDLGNLVKVIVHYLTIEGMTCFSSRDGVPMVSALECMVSYTLDRPMVNHDVRLSGCHDSPRYYVAWTLNLERILSLCWNQQEILTYGWDPNVVIYPYKLGHYWWRLVTTCVLNRGTMISHGIEIMCHLGWSKGYVIMKYVAIVISSVEFDICFLKLEYVNWSHNRRICNSRIRKVILMGWWHHLIILLIPVHRESTCNEL